MKKIRLGEVLEVKRGASLSGKYYSSKGNLIRLTLGNFNYPNNGFKYNTSKDDLYFNGIINKEFILKKGDIITPLTEQVRGLLGNTATIPIEGTFIQSGDIGLIIPNEELIDKRFSYYLVSSPIVKKQLDAGSQQTKIRHTSPDRIKGCIAFLPELNAQKKIAKFLDDINEKIDVNNAINDNLYQVLDIIYDTFFMKPYNNNSENLDIVETHKLLEVKTGKEDANFSVPNGEYNFFTCSKDILKCNQPAFHGSAVLIAGNGDFNVKHYTGQFNAYQRTYVLIPKNTIYYGTIYMSSLKLIKKFKSGSSGSIVKFISKSDVENIKIIIPKNELYLKILNEYLYSIERNQLENEKLIKLRNELLPLLINGQVTLD